MSVNLVGPKFYGWKADGSALAYGELYSYQAGTTTIKKATFGADGVTENSNPVILNGSGYADVKLEGEYYLVLKDREGNVIWSEDEFSSNNNDEWVNCLAAAYSSTTVFTVTGNQTASLVAGIRVRLYNGSTYVYATVLSSEYTTSTAVTISKPVVPADLTIACVSIVSPQSLPAADASPTADTVAVAKTLALEPGESVVTRGYDEIDDGGQSSYFTKTAAQAAIDGDVIDTYVNHLLNNGNVIILQVSGQVNIAQAGIFADKATNSLAFNALSAVLEDITAGNGTFEFTDPIVKAGSISIVGSGSTYFQFEDTNGLALSYSDPESRISLKDFTLINIGETSGTALIVAGTVGADESVTPNLIVHNVDCRGNSEESGWEDGLLGSGISRVDIDGFGFDGKFVGNDYTGLSGDALYLVGTDVNNGQIINCKIYHANDGIREELYKSISIRDNEVLQCLRPIKLGTSFYSSLANVNVVIEGNLLGYFNNGININYINNTVIQNNRIFNIANGSALGRTSIYGSTALNTIIKGNVIDDRVGDRDTAVAGDTFQATIGGNVFIGLDDITNNLTSSTIEAGNRYINIGTFPYVSAGTAVTFPLKRSAIYNSAATPTISSSTPTALTFDDNLGNNFVYNTGGSSRLTADFAGLYKISALIEFPYHASGYRFAEIRKNGVAVVGFPKNNCEPTGDSQTTLMPLPEALVLLAASDYIELWVTQTSGSDMTIPIDNSFLKMEWVGYDDGQG